jgi:cytochrome c peroxidase
MHRPTVVLAILLTVLADNSGAQSRPLGLPPVPWPKDNPYSESRVALGRNLFFDARLSIDGLVSCANCHRPELAFSGGQTMPRGVSVKPLARRVPTLVNRAYGRSEFYDGRAASLEEQIHFPVSNADEMGSAPQTAAAAISNIAGYAPLFVQAFGDSKVTFERIEKAIASFERTILSGNSPYDRFLNGDQAALTPAAQRGLRIFDGAGKCNQCHRGFNLTDEKFAGLGIGPDRAPFDFGLAAISRKKRDTGKFKVPTLREVARTAPYMHDGRFRTLDDVLEFYRKGCLPGPDLDPRIAPFPMDASAKADLLAFLVALNGEGWQQIKRPAKLP